MKLPIRIIVVVGSLLLGGQSFARGLIARVTDTTLISSIVLDYPEILGVDQAGQSPFVRFEAAAGSEDQLEFELSQDERLVWINEEGGCTFPEKQSSHGSSVAAIYDRDASFAINSTVWQQINYNPMPVPTGTPIIRVGIVDTGVSPLQPSLRASIEASASFVPGSPTIDDLPMSLDTDGDGVMDSGTGHGTMIAGIILQLAPQSRLVVAKSADSDGIATSWSVIKGVVFCIENNSKLVNISLGSNSQLTAFSDFLDWVEDAGVVLISPIGNDDTEAALYPASYSRVICVTGLLPTNQKAPFSNWSVKARSAAPATGIESAWWDGNTAIWSGTSFAAPLLTGSLAAALPLCPTRSPKEIRQIVRSSGKDLDCINPGYETKLGTLLDYQSLLGMLMRRSQRID